MLNTGHNLVQQLVSERRGEWKNRYSLWDCRSSAVIKVSLSDTWINMWWKQRTKRCMKELCCFWQQRKNEDKDVNKAEKDDEWKKSPLCRWCETVFIGSWGDLFHSPTGTGILLVYFLSVMVQLYFFRWAHMVSTLLAQRKNKGLFDWLRVVVRVLN